jgi:hypothetical protein
MVKTTPWTVRVDSSTHLTYNNEPGMNSQTYRQVNALVLFQTCVQSAYGLNNSQATSDGSLGIIFVCYRVAKVDQQTITQMLRYVAMVSGNDIGTSRVVCPNDVTEIFWVKFPR